MHVMRAFLATCLLSSVAVADDDVDPYADPNQPSQAVQPVNQMVAPAAAPAPVAVTTTAPPAEHHIPVIPTGGYGMQGTFELGASGGLTLGAQTTGAVNLNGSIGKYIADNFALTGILDATNFWGGGESAQMVTALVEPSFHLPFTSSRFGFIGMGVGASYVNQLGTAMAVAPRLGMDFLVGKSGILRPSLSYQYTTHDPREAADKNGMTPIALAAVQSALRFNIGYSTMF